MKRLVLASIALLITACGQQEPSPVPLADRNVALGTRLSVDIEQPYRGEWTISELPDWLSASTLSSRGPVKLTLTARRHLATPPTADRPQLEGKIEIRWQDESGQQKGTAIWTVTADQYSVSGRVLAPATVTGNDLGEPLPLQTHSEREVRGVIVTYHDAALRDAVLSPGLSAQALSAVPQARQARAALEQLGVGPQDRRPVGETSVVLAVRQPEEAIAALGDDPAVAAVTPNVVLRALGTVSSPVIPTDQYAPLQFAYKLMGYGAVWRDMESGGYTRPVTVAVADSGVRYDHPDLAGQLWTPEEGALDVLSSPNNGDGDGIDRDPTDPSFQGRKSGSHGTHVTGIIVARWGQNAATCSGCSPTGVVGAAYRAPIKVLPIRVLDSNGQTDIADVATAVRYAAGLPVTVKMDGQNQTLTNPHPAQVLNLSLGGEKITAGEAQVMCDAIAEARAAGTLTFAAAGNFYSKLTVYPAACPAAVSVASVTLTGGSAPEHARYSNSYAEVMLSAPGGSGGETFYTGGTFNGKNFPDDIVSTGWDYAKNAPNYVTMSGTSQASPQVAAVAALLLSKGVTRTPEETLRRLIATATDLGPRGRDPQTGYGMVNAAAALQAPAVSDRLGVRLDDDLGHSYRPPLNALGQFTAYLGEGTYRVIGGEDRDDNLIYGETHEARAERTAAVGPQQPQVEVGDLRPVRP